MLVWSTYWRPISSPSLGDAILSRGENMIEVNLSKRVGVWLLPGLGYQRLLGGVDNEYSPDPDMGVGDSGDYGLIVTRTG